MKTLVWNKYVWVILISMLCSSMKAQTGRFYSTDDGLSSSLINQLFQDNRGFIWVATEYGLNRFDGLSFSSYRHLPGDSVSITDNYVRTLFEDSRHNLLVGCINGLMKYDRESDTFQQIPVIRAGKRVFPHITQMQELRNGEIWMSTTGQGMFRLDAQLTQAVSVDSILQQANFNFQSKFCVDSRHNIWIGTDESGLIHYLPESNEIQQFKYPVLNDNNVSAIIEDLQGTIFVGTRKQGLSRYDQKSGRLLPVSYVGKDDKISVYCLAMVNGQLWVGTDGQGVKVYDPLKDQLEDYRINSAPMDFSNGKVHSILEDKDGNVWLGLFQKGIVLLPKQANPFEYYGSKSVYYNPIGQGCVMSVFQDSKRHLWVSADNEGVYELGTDGRLLQHYQPGSAESSVANTVMCIYEDTDRNLWLGSYSKGLAKLDRRSGKCEYFRSINNAVILSITEDKNKNLYIATLGSGFYRYNLKSKEMKHYESSRDEMGDLKRNELPNDWVNYIFCDSKGLIWLGHYKGVSCFNPQTESFVNYKKVNTLITGCVGYAFLEDHEGNIWAGTTDGLYRFTKKTSELSKFTTSEGLPNNVICGLCEDAERNIWISTYKGISKYDAKNNSFVNYYSGDGLQGNEFTHGAFFKDNTGKIYFGGVNGITSFLPRKISSASKNVKVWITDFYIFNQPVRKNTLSGGEPVIYSSVQDANIFQLAHQDNTFTITFSTLQYNNPEQISYQYKIEELSNQWSSTDTGVNRVTYNNLPPGKYTFRVRALNQGNYSEVKTLKILVASPWHQTWWAYCLYIALAGLLMLIIINNILSRMHHRREIMKREHAEQLNEAKLQFFINISHEIRTPMTLIINPLEKLLSEPDTGERHKTYLMIYRNAQRILRLINQLMDIRKLDKGQMFMKFRETDMIGFIDDVMQPFEYLARKKNVNFTFVHDMSQMKAWVDLHNFDKVLMNILSNAFKYTPEDGEIQVSLTVGRDASRKDELREFFEIAVTDTGIGIDRNKIERIFERFYQIDNDVTKSNFGTGIGLHLSRLLVQLHHGSIYAENRTDVSGSRFVIRIPLGAAHLRADELEEVNPAKVIHPQIINLEEELVNDTSESTSGKRGNRQLILVVEDDEEIRSYLKSELSDDYKVVTCCNGKEAYDLILKGTFDLVISDIMMPEMDGMALCRKLKQNTNVNHIPIILLTAKSQTEDTLEGMEIGADAYMVKPFNTELLKSTIANLINNRRLLRNKFSGAQQQEDKMDKISMKSNDEILMAKIMKIVNEHLSDSELSVEMLASEVGLSRVHMHRKLKELTNLSTRDFIKNIRLQQAASLFAQDKKLTISEVAYAVGFVNLSHFSNSFKEKYGVSPKEYTGSKHS